MNFDKARTAWSLGWLVVRPFPRCTIGSFTMAPKPIPTSSSWPIRSAWWVIDIYWAMWQGYGRFLLKSAKEVLKR